MMHMKHLHASQILDDCQRALDLLEEVSDGDKQLFRIYWIFCLVALRQVKDVLEKQDLIAFPEMRTAYEKRKDELWTLKGKYGKDTPFSECSMDYLVYHRLIHGERNTAVHEVRETYSGPWAFYGPTGMVELGDIYLPMGDIDLWGDWDCRDWLQHGIDWWREEIAGYLPEEAQTARVQR